MSSIRKYEVSFRVSRPDGSSTIEFITFTCFSCLSALCNFQEWSFHDPDCFLGACEVEVLGVHKVS